MGWFAALGRTGQLRALRRTAEGTKAEVQAAGTEAEVDGALRRLRKYNDTARVLEEEVSEGGMERPPRGLGGSPPIQLAASPVGHWGSGSPPFGHRGGAGRG